MLINSDAFQQQARQKAGDFTRQRTLPLSQLIPLLLNYRKGTLQDELDQFFDTLAMENGAARTVSVSALCQARQKLKYEAFIQLNDALLDQIGKQIGQKRWKGFRLLAVDGSTARLPNTPKIENYFGKPRNSGVPLARFSRLYDVLNQQIVQADMQPYATGERELAAYYLLHSSPQDLMIYDRGYPAFWLFALHAMEGRDFCARVKHDFHPEVKRFLASGKPSEVVTLTPSDSSARQCREYHLPEAPLSVRLVRIALKSGEIEVLATSLLDEAAYTVQDLCWLYRQRWAVEENYKREKQRLEIENFSGRSPQVILQDFHAKIFAQNLASVFVTLAQWLADQHYRQRKYRYQINFANALSKMKNTLVQLFLHRSPLDVCRQVIEKIRRAVEAVRPDRSYPRDLKKVRVPAFQGNYKRTR